MHPASSVGPTSGAGPGRDRPRFRQDLIAETVEHQGSRFIDVMAPEGENVFRFYEVEYSLACGMDGERDVAGIMKWAQDELGLTPSPQEVRAVIATLGDLGFIESSESGASDQEPELAPGVVTGDADRAARPTPSPDFDLGAAGVDHADTERGVPLPPAPELSLGRAGAPRTARPTPQPPPDISLGAPGRTTRPTPAPPVPSFDDSEDAEVSIDLSDHIAVRPDDVKEAVRASRVMSAVVPPPEADEPGDVTGALQAIQDPPTGPASAFDAPTVARIPDPAMLAELTPRPPQVRQPDPARSPSSDLPTADTIRVGKAGLRAPANSTKPPVELPAAPVTVKVDKPMPPPNQQRSGSSSLVLVVVILAVVAAGVFFAWKYLLERPAIDVDTSSAPVPVPSKPAPPPPPPPPPPTAKIVLETPDPEEVKVTRQGVIETVSNGPVTEGQVVVKLKGNKPLEAQVHAMEADINRQHQLLDAATKRFDTAHAAGNKAVEASAQKEISERHQLIDAKDNALNAKRADQDTYQVHAPKAGTFVSSTKPNAQVAADAVIGKIVRDAIPVATFKATSTQTLAANASVEIAIHKGEQRLTCTVVDVQADSVKVVCPVDPELTEGAEVALQLPSSTSSAPPEPPPMPSSGSAAGSGSAAPSEGAAAPAGETAAPAGGSAAPAAGSDGK